MKQPRLEPFKNRGHHGTKSGDIKLHGDGRIKSENSDYSEFSSRDSKNGPSLAGRHYEDSRRGSSSSLHHNNKLDHLNPALLELANKLELSNSLQILPIMPGYRANAEALQASIKTEQESSRSSGNGKAARTHRTSVRDRGAPKNSLKRENNNGAPYGTGSALHHPNRTGANESSSTGKSHKSLLTNKEDVFQAMVSIFRPFVFVALKYNWSFFFANFFRLLCSRNYLHSGGVHHLCLYQCLKSMETLVSIRRPTMPPLLVKMPPPRRHLSQRNSSRNETRQYLLRREPVTIPQQT